MFEQSKPYPSGPDGQRAYVVGDVHGRLDLHGGGRRVAPPPVFQSYHQGLGFLQPAGI